MASTISDQTAQAATALFNNDALRAAPAVTRTTLVIVTDDINGVWAYALPDTLPTERELWLREAGVDLDLDDLNPEVYYAFGYIVNGRLIREGNDEELKLLVDVAHQTYAATGEEMFPLERPSKC
jgi:hypothetical protein